MEQRRASDNATHFAEFSTVSGLFAAEVRLFVGCF